jgi:hypothetical protein
MICVRRPYVVDELGDALLQIHAAVHVARGAAPRTAELAAIHLNCSLAV